MQPDSYILPIIFQLASFKIDASHCLHFPHNSSAPEFSYLFLVFTYTSNQQTLYVSIHSSRWINLHTPLETGVVAIF